MKVLYNYNLYDKVYFLYEGRKCKGYIEEININIKHMERDDYDDEWIIEPIITYRIKDKWFKESELFKTKEDFYKI